MTDYEDRIGILKRIDASPDIPPHEILGELKKLGFDDRVLKRHLIGLEKDDLIDAKFRFSSRSSDRPLIHAMISITSRGLDAIQNPQTFTPQVVMGNNVNIHNSQQVQVGDHNIQGITIEKLNAAVDGSQATFNEKQEAKSLLAKLAGNKLVMAVLASVFTGISTSAK
jgi:hypothetical protein